MKMHLTQRKPQEIRRNQDTQHPIDSLQYGKNQVKASVQY